MKGPKTRFQCLSCSQGKKIREVKGSVVIEDMEEDYTKMVTMLTLLGLGSSLLYCYRRFWEECRGDY